MAHDPRFNNGYDREKTDRLIHIVNAAANDEVHFNTNEAARLIRGGANAGALNQVQKRRLLMRMAGSDDSKVVETLLQSFGYDEEDLDEAVHRASRTFGYDTDDALKTLLENGGRPSREDLKMALKQESIGGGMGHRTMKVGFNKVKHILENNPYLINTTARDGFADDSTPLMYALKTHDGHRCSINVIRLLLEHGADPNLQDAEGKTPLMYAAKRDQHIVRLLLEHGAEPLLQNKKGSFAKNYGKSKPIKSLLKINNNNEKNNSTRRRGGDRSRSKKNRK
jgi:hypothetical protein